MNNLEKAIVEGAIVGTLFSIAKMIIKKESDDIITDLCKGAVYGGTVGASVALITNYRIELSADYISELGIYTSLKILPR